MTRPADDAVLYLTGAEVAASLRGTAHRIVEIVADAYASHAEGLTVLPHSSFLRFPDSPSDRIIALPALLADGAPIAGIKWVSSFPRNVTQGWPRASAILVLNSTKTGHVTAILEGALISAVRTAAAAALATKWLRPSQVRPKVALIGCGPINWQVLRFVSGVVSQPRSVHVYDLDPRRAADLAARVHTANPDVAVKVAKTFRQAIRNCDLVSFATTAARPHVETLAGAASGTLVLHLSLRDLAPSLVRRCDNIVDDIDHALREGTSLELTERELGSRSFVRGTLSDVMASRIPARVDSRPIVFSPFGLGVLDLALARFVAGRAAEMGIGQLLSGLQPTDADEVI